MSSAPADLLELRRIVMAETGLTDPVSVGIVGDGAHQRTGGYHEGKDVLTMIGRYHPGAAAGSTGEDYSCRLSRDRAGLTNSSSGMDIGYRWPKGGNAAWLRFNNLLVDQLLKSDSALAPIRGVNYSPDGKAKVRRDRQNGFTAQSTTDTVDVHTHIEFYRDTEGRREACIARLGQLMHAAVTGGQLPATVAATQEVSDEMMMLATDGKNWYMCNGMWSRVVPSATDADRKNATHLAQQLGFAHGPTGGDAEWMGQYGGWVRTGWYPELYGPVVNAATVPAQPAAGTPGVTTTQLADAYTAAAEKLRGA
jgi:hypothetical protein